MSTATDMRPRRRAWQNIVRGVVSLSVFAAIAVWFLFSLFLATTTCDDNCSGDQSSWWGYSAQFALAAVGSIAGVVALVLGFRAQTILYYGLLTALLICAVVWFMWVLGGSSTF